MIRRLALLIGFTLVCVACAPTNRINTPVSCFGGQRVVGGYCTCALGMTWNGQFCQGEALAGRCTNGYVQFGNTCMCPDGTAADGLGKCVALECASRNAIVSGNECSCADGTEWDETTQQCVQVTCSGGAVLAGSICVCVEWGRFGVMISARHQR